MDDDLLSEDNIRRTLRIKKHADGLIPASAERSIRFIAWVVGGLMSGAAAIVVGTIFVIKLMNGQADLKERVSKLEGWQSGIAQTLTNMQITIASNKLEIEKRTDSIKHADIMWTQRGFGISNKEVFYIDKGFAPPSISAAQPYPSPRPGPTPTPNLGNE